MFDWSKYAVGGAKRPDSFTGLNPNFSTALSQMLQAAEAELGQNALSITSAYRSPEKQAELYQAAIEKYGSPTAARKWVAPPGSSMHNKGLAVDFGAAGGGLLRDPNSREAQWLKANASKFGLAVPMDWEPWQVELAGARDGEKTAAETMSLLGKGPQTPTKGPQMMQEEKPRGLLGSLGIQKMEEGAEGETGQRFYNRDSFKDTALLLAQGFGRMGVMGMEEIAADVAKQRTENKARNKTAEYLRANGRGDLADMVDQGLIGGREAAGVLLQKPEERGQVVSAAELRKMYPGTEIADGLYNLKKDDTITKVGGAPQVVIDQSAPGAESELRKKLMGKRGEELAAHISAGNVAAGRQGDLNILQELAPLAPSGPVEGRFAEMFPEFNDVAAVRQSVVRRIAPTMRVEGSGSTSDIEFNAMLDSFGSLRNTPEANMAISQAMINKAQFDMQRRDIVQQYANDQIGLKEMDAQIAALESNFSIPSQVRSILDKYSTGGAASSGGAGVPEVGTVSDGYRFKGGNPADQSNWEKI